MTHDSEVELLLDDVDTVRQGALQSLDEAEWKAWDSLSRYKFVMFGYWAGQWVLLNRVSGALKPNPWRSLVEAARAKKETL